MRLSFIHFILIFFVQLFIPANINAESAHEYVDRIHGNIIQVIREKQPVFETNPKEFIQSVEDTLEPLVDYERISRGVMGMHYKSASLAQKERFSEVFKSTLLNTYSKVLAEFQNEEIRVLPKAKKSSKPNREKVYIEIITNTKVYPAVYNMRLNKKGEWKIINIILNGVNLGLTFRNQFYSLMKIQENDVDRVINNWIASV